jgi:DNA-binding winged helix-turn-helix (wHTH) protein
MARTHEYEKLLAELENGKLEEIKRKILEALLRAPQGLTRKGLIRVVFDEEAQKNLSNDTRYRKIRKAIESLRDKGVPIVSTSGKAGYKLETDPEKIVEMLGEMKSRIAHLERKVEAIQSFSNYSMKRQDE